jgi:signal peptidase I
MSSGDISTTDQTSSMFALRQTARGRAWVCPGAGFAMLGHSQAAFWTYATSILSLLAALVAVFVTTSVTVGVAVLLLCLSTVLWIAEITTTYSAWPAEATVPAASHGYRFAAAVLWLLILLLAAGLWSSFRVLQVGGNGMSPQLHDGDRVVYRRRVDHTALKPGQIVLFELDRDSKIAEPGTYVLGRILAKPGDALSLRDDTYYVNGRAERRAAPTQPYPTALDIARYPRTIVVPIDCYFVVQDSPDAGLDGRVLSWVDFESIVSTELFQLGGASLIRRIE